MRWAYCPERSFQLVVREAHRVQECIPARVLFQVREERIPPHAGQASVALPARALEPLEGPILLPAIRVDLGDLVSRRIGKGLG